MSRSELPHESETAASVDPLGYSRSALRQCPRVSWTDATGAHQAQVTSRMTVGSAADVEIVLADPSVSRLHADFQPEPDGLWVRDLGSRNGTFVEGLRVSGACVPEGGMVQLGGSTLWVSYAPQEVRVDLWPDGEFGALLGASDVMRELFSRIARVAAMGSTVLIAGETGTGKELVARAIHEASARAEGPFVVVDCGALPEGLLEAELFGHAKGAFTGADAARAGAIESAQGGTVFLDEIGELPLAVQPKLLRVLESRVVRRVGEPAHRSVDVRFVSATHRNLRRMVNDGAFREDLYFRLAVLPITVPPLRDRLGDVPALVQRFLPVGAGPMDPGLLRELVTRPWPGNVRELRNFVERALALGATEALALSSTDVGATRSAGASVASLSALPLREARERWIDGLEREYVAEVLARHGHNVTAAAEAAGVARSYLHRLIRKHGL